MSPSTTSKVTTDHGEIRRWAEERGGRPAAVGNTETDNDPGIIRLEFPDAPNSKDKALGEISWDEWFRKFDQNSLAFLYQEHMADGENSNFNKIIKRETPEQVRRAVGGRGRSATHKPSTSSVIASATRSQSRSRKPGREETNRKSTSARRPIVSSSRAGTRSRSAKRAADSGQPVASRRGQLRSSRTTGRTGGSHNSPRNLLGAK